MEENNDKLDSLEITKNSRGLNYKIKCYGSNEKEIMDKVEALKGKVETKFKQELEK